MKAHDPMRERWRRFRKRPRAERVLILQAMAVLPLTGMGLRILGFRRWKKLMDRFSAVPLSARAMDSTEQVETAGRVVRAVRSAELHGLGTPNCLERSLTLRWLLRRQGIGGELHIGARKNGSRLEAHAWVELDGQVLNDTPEVHIHYSRFDAPIAEGSGNHARANVETATDAVRNVPQD
ncbi:MAG: lasso peptide biosynthesis B2 protein [Candidatus Acidiferrales bacterium]